MVSELSYAVNMYVPSACECEFILKSVKKVWVSADSYGPFRALSFIIQSLRFIHDKLILKV